MTIDLSSLESAMRASVAIYQEAKQAVVEANPEGWEATRGIDPIRPAGLRQEQATFEAVYAAAAEARTLLMAAVAREWAKKIGEPESLLFTVDGTQFAWVEEGVDPGLKGQARARQKVRCLCARERA